MIFYIYLNLNLQTHNHVLDPVGINHNYLTLLIYKARGIEESQKISGNLC